MNEISKQVVTFLSRRVLYFEVQKHQQQ